MNIKKPLLFRLVSILVGLMVSILIVTLLHFCGIVNLDPLISHYDRLNSDRVAQEKKIRILGVGDSFLQPWPHLSFSLNDGFRAFFSRRGMGAVVVADSGSGPDFYLKTIRQQFAEFSPHLVVVFYYVGNDTTDTILGHTSIGDPDDKSKCHCDPAAAEAYRFDWKMMTDCGVDPKFVELARQSKGQPRNVGMKVVSPFLICMGLSRPMIYRENILMDGEDAELAWEKSRKILGQIFSVVRQHRSELLIVAIPAAVQVHERYHDFYKRIKIMVDRRFLDTAVPQARLRELCNKNKVKFLDLLPSFRKHTQAGELYMPLDDHFSAAGHKLAMKSIEQFLVSWTKVHDLR